MIKRIKRLWSLSKKDPVALEKLTDEQIDSLPSVGNGKAVFFSEPTLEEEKELEREDKGFKGIFGIGL